MPLRPCLDCGTLTRTTRCPAHTRRTEYARTLGKRARRPRIPAAEDKRRSQTVAAWRAAHGDWCPGWHRPPHPSADLTADHITPVAAGGSETGPLTVLCRSCNSAKAARVGAEGAGS